MPAVTVMGYHNVTRALITTDLTPRTKLALIQMALTAIDPEATAGAAPNLYWAGWPHIAIGMGYPKWEPTTKRSVARAITELIHSGYVQAAGYTPNGRRVYQLHLDLGDTHVTPEVTPMSPHR